MGLAKEYIIKPIKNSDNKNSTTENKISTTENKIFKKSNYDDIKNHVMEDDDGRSPSLTALRAVDNPDINLNKTKKIINNIKNFKYFLI
jgi:hypothetical protein